MRYMRCKCGKDTCWTTMGHPDCDGCPECHTTLAEGPDGHREIAPHDWREEWTIDKQTGERGKERICVQCRTREPVPLPDDATAPEERT